MMNDTESDISLLLEQLHKESGASFVMLLKAIVARGEFHPLAGDEDIFVVGGQQSDDFSNLLNAARKAVSFGNRVYILPNPHGIRTADFIFERKGVYKMFDLKTVIGKGSVDNRLAESVGQSNRVLLNIITDYRAGLLARAILTYFERSADAREVLVFKGNKAISITRQTVFDKNFIIAFSKKYYK